MTKNDVINKIAREILHLETLKTRKMDALDFQEQAVWSIAEALSAAYEAGRNELLTAAQALLDAKDNQMETAVEWRRLRKAVKAARTRP